MQAGGRARHSTERMTGQRVGEDKPFEGRGNGTATHSREVVRAVHRSGHGRSQGSVEVRLSHSVGRVEGTAGQRVGQVRGQSAGLGSVKIGERTGERLRLGSVQRRVLGRAGQKPRRYKSGQEAGRG